jgi:hypothetical protein
MQLEIGEKIVFKVVAFDAKIVVVSGVIVYYDGLSGIYTIKDQNGILHYRAINKIWKNVARAQKTLDSGTLDFVKLLIMKEE